jgi:hypothetical protein
MAQRGRRSGANFPAIRSQGIDVKLFENPVFLTQKRLTHRVGVLAAVLIAALIGLSLLSGQIAYLTSSDGITFSSSQEAGKVFYGWVLGLEILILIMGGFSRTARTLADERKSGIWDSNRLTPLHPSQLVTGYWFGTPLREFYMGAVLAVIGLVIVILGRLPVTLWLGTQVLVASTALLFGLMALLVGMAFQRPQSGFLLLLGFIFLQAFALFKPKFLVTNFLLPIYSLVHLFRIPAPADEDSSRDWSGLPEIFGLHVHPILLSLGLQLVVGWFLWRIIVRKTANPFQPLMLRREVVALFGILIGVQHGLLWGVWHGQYPNVQAGSYFGSGDSNFMLQVVQGAALLLGIVLLTFASPLPERVRVEALRTSAGNLRLVFSRSAVSLALALAAVAGAALLTQCLFSIADTWKTYLLAVGNLLDFFLIFILLVEFCRLKFRNRAMGFVALGLFILCVLPFILAGVFSDESIAYLSLLSPGVMALGEPNGGYYLKDLAVIVPAHFGVAVLLFFAWLNQWKQLLARTAPAAPER